MHGAQPLYIRVRAHKIGFHMQIGIAAKERCLGSTNVAVWRPSDFNIAQNLFKGKEKKTKKGNIKKGGPFTLPHCYEELKDDEKWKKRDGIDDVDESNKRKKIIELDHDEEEASSDDDKRIPTPNSVTYSKPKRPNGCKKDGKEKKKRKGGDELKNAIEAIVKARKEANEVRKMARTQDAAAEERRLADEERRVAVEERKVAMEERSRLLEWEKYLFFLDTSTLNEVQKQYINLTREEVLIQKRAMLHSMGGGGIGDMGGGSIGGMGGFGAPSGGVGGMHGWRWHGRHGRHGWLRSTSGRHWRHGRRWHWRHGWLRSTFRRHWCHGRYEFCVYHGRHGSTPGAMGGMSSGVPTPSHDLANTREEEEQESASDDESEEEEDEDQDEDEDEA
ncbi:UDP-glycosyltransferase 73C6 [Hordeum vulgare]|nr:UDP-glycosyltransferase 73C6 [Hordeum vulgare]